MQFSQPSAKIYLTLLLTVFLIPVATQAKPPIEVIAFQAENIEVQQSLHALGKLEAKHSVDLAFKVKDKLTAIHVQSGQAVKKGQLLFELDQQQQQAKLQQAIALEKEALAQYRRVKKAISRTSVTESLVDEKYRLWQTAIAERNIQQTLLEQRKLHAPFSGTLGLFNLSLGAFVNDGETLVNLSSNQQMKIHLLLPSDRLAAIKTGLAIKVNSDAYPEQQFTGQISALSNRLEPNSRMLPIEAIIDNPDNLLKANMLVEAKISLPSQQQLQVPNSSLLMLGDKEFVYRLTATEKGLYKAEKIQVQVGDIHFDNSQILSGIQAGDLIVSQGVMRVNSKAKIKLKAMQNSLSQKQLLNKAN